MTKLAVFDWNGTLLDDVEATLIGANAIFEYLGKEPLTLDVYLETITIPVKGFFMHHGVPEAELDAKADETAAIFDRVYHEAAEQCSLHEGAEELLRHLAERGTRSIVLSNHIIRSIDGLLNKFKCRELVSDLLANESLLTAWHSLTKGERLRRFLEENELSPGDVIILGDSPEEAEIGRELGVRSVLLTGGSYSEARLRAAKPDYLFHELAKVREIL